MVVAVVASGSPLFLDTKYQTISSISNITICALRSLIRSFVFSLPSFGCFNKQSEERKKNSMGIVKMMLQSPIRMVSIGNSNYNIKQKKKQFWG